MVSFQYWYKSFCPATPTLLVRRNGGKTGNNGQGQDWGWAFGSKEDQSAGAPHFGGRGPKQLPSKTHRIISATTNVTLRGNINHSSDTSFVHACPA